MAQVYEYTGVVEEVHQTETVGQNGFQKREIIIGNDLGDPSKYPNPKKFVFKKDKCQLLDMFRKGQRVKVKFALDGRRWDGPRGTQFFVDLTGISIFKADGDSGASGGTHTAPPPAEPPHEQVDYHEVQDDMPF